MSDKEKIAEMTAEAAEAANQEALEDGRKMMHASHSIAQAAVILTLFSKDDLFKHGADTNFAIALSNLALECVVENKKLFD